MSEKGPARMGSSYVLYGEANEPLQPVMRVVAPGDDSFLVMEQRLYVMALAQYPSTRRTTSKLMIKRYYSSNNHRMDKVSIELNNILIGLILGDCSIRRKSATSNSQLCFKQGIKNKEYI